MCSRRKTAHRPVAEPTTLPLSLIYRIRLYLSCCNNVRRILLSDDALDKLSIEEEESCRFSLIGLVRLRDVVVEYVSIPDSPPRKFLGTMFEELSLFFSVLEGNVVVGTKRLMGLGAAAVATMGSILIELVCCLRTRRV